MDFFEAWAEARAEAKAEKLFKKLNKVHCKRMTSLLELYMPHQANELRHQGYQRGYDYMTQQIERNLKDMGLKAARVMEDKIAGMETNARYLVYKIPISDFAALDMMSRPNKNESEQTN